MVAVYCAKRKLLAAYFASHCQLLLVIRLLARLRVTPVAKEKNVLLVGERQLASHEQYKGTIIINIVSCLRNCSSKNFQFCNEQPFLQRL